MLLQKTIKRPVDISGVGLHSGKPVSMRILPAKSDTGIVFKRADLNDNAIIKPKASSVTETQLCTVIESDGIKIATVEHILSALSGLSIDNAIIEVNAAEIPIVDGSAAPFVFLLQNAGIIKQDAVKKFMVIKEEVIVKDNDKWARLSPFTGGFKLDFVIDFEHPAIQKTGKNHSIILSKQKYIQEVSRARTFGFLHDIEFLRQNNLALGGSLDNAVVLDEYRVLNERGLRFDDEFVRHKLLDAIGDLYIEGVSIIGHYQGYKSGHALNNSLYCALLNNPSAFEIKTMDSNDIPDIKISTEESTYLI